MNEQRRASTLSGMLKEGMFAERLIELYGWKYVEPQIKRYRDAMDKFQKVFGDRELYVFSAPGRTEIGGNHTDHQNGEVLAAAINLDVLALASPNNRGLIRVYSEGYGAIQISVEELDRKPGEEGTTSALIRGVAGSLRDLGYQVGGFDAFMTSDVLSGSGLSSSAAFETAIGCVISGLYNDMEIPDQVIGKVGQRAENLYFGKPCGLMDQMACACGGLNYMDFQDSNNPIVEKLHYDFAAHGYSICVTNTGGSHADLTEDYASIPDEMFQVAHLLNKNSLRGVTFLELVGRANEIRQECGDRALLRAIHFVGESVRAAREARMLYEGDLEGFLQEYRNSGDSSWKYLQNIYPCGSSREQNMAAALGISEAVLGNCGIARVHGGGFAGTIQAFVTEKKTEEYRKTMDGIFGEGACMVLRVRDAGGVQVI